jgi:formate hydrogenlyase transcriptional activator
MMTLVAVSESEIYRALFNVAESISGHSTLDSLLEGLSGALHQVVQFEHIAIILYSPEKGLAAIHALKPDQPANSMGLAFEETPTQWVWERQQPLVLADISKETRWPVFLQKVCAPREIASLCLIPLTSGEHRLGALGFGSTVPNVIAEEELAFLCRVGKEVAVTVDAFQVRQELTLERDRLRVLFDITNALVSKLSAADLFSAVSGELSRIIPHDFAVMATLDRETGKLHRYAVKADFEKEFEEACVCAEGLPAGEAIATGQPVISDHPDPERFPSELYRKVAEFGLYAHCCFPLITGNGTIGTLDLARRSRRPFSADEVALGFQVARQIAIALENAMTFRELAEMRDKLASEKLYLENEIRGDWNIGNMIGESAAFQTLIQSVRIVAPTDTTVLITGETGTGKELVARALHDLSKRAKATLVKVNCAAIPATLLESELFGHEKGAFTGALNQKTGRFELADRGTLFLDEIGEIPLELQAKLLRAIQEQEFERLGGSRTIRVDTRLIAATNRDLKAMVDEGRFRSDLYYRLHVFPLQAPPLRHRREDIPLLAKHFAQQYARRINRNIARISSASLDAMVKYDWPGNIRELQNVIERSVVLSRDSTLQAAVPLSDQAGSVPPPEMDRGAERDRILRVLKECRGVVAGPNGAAARLGLKRTILQSRMRRLNILRKYN